jgi:exosome complex component CSL4
MKEQFVMPGDQLSTSEELLPGDGTYEEDGIIRASRVGHYIVNEQNRHAEVKPVTSIPVQIRNGDIVIARVVMVKTSMVIADVIHVAGKNRGVSGDTNGTIHVKEIAAGYVKDACTEYHTGDYIRARVIQTKPSLQLATKDRNLGVIKALCGKCRGPFIRKGPGLECAQCGYRDKRSLADDYGNYDLSKL